MKEETQSLTMAEPLGLTDLMCPTSHVPAEVLLSLNSV